MNTAIWIIQGLMGALFLMAGAMKVTQAKTTLKEKLGGWVDDFSILTLKAIGAIEILGATALILPMLLNKYLFLTPLAATGLILTMIGASIAHLKRKENKEIIKNIVITALLIAILVGRKSLLF